MKLFRSIWVVAILAIVLNLGATAGMLFLRWESIFHKKPVPAANPPKVPPRMWTFASEEVDKLVEELKAGREKLAKREKELDQTAAQIGAERAELETTRAEIAAMRNEINKMFPEVEQVEAKNLKSLAVTYSSMNASAAVAILKEMDDPTTVKILALMKPDKVASILQEMTKPQDAADELVKRAARLSDMLRFVRQQKKSDSES
jgi:flagellar motility protein MotE (MotC chaperone)